MRPSPHIFKRPRPRAVPTLVGCYANVGQHYYIPLLRFLLLPTLHDLERCHSRRRRSASPTPPPSFRSPSQTPGGSSIIFHPCLADPAPAMEKHPQAFHLPQAMESPLSQRCCLCVPPHRHESHFLKASVAKETGTSNWDSMASIFSPLILLSSSKGQRPASCLWNFWRHLRSDTQ